ncbi:M20/M25/M40 family metallo-hydrolase [Epidermidibacterium keratini]|uniref:M20/M25/M40 family metallo-hydrolase n=1 Tax=Epidermidibacterium keratini TaxID=1891644 RepID=UPI001CEF8C56|nr:M20/M25/M40 family metallo-hydrolase [Epidermidibacterium keratini]
MSQTTSQTPVPDDAFDEVVTLCSELIAIDSTNTGDPQTLVGEREAAEYVAAKLREVGLEPQIIGEDEKRANVIVRIPGADSDRGGLLVHGHLDVVPAEPAEWSVDPFGGVIKDGYVWGRGAVDMKDMDAMMLAVVRRWAREGIVPPRDMVFAWVADEEHGGIHGAHWLVDNHPDLFEGCTEAVGEVGGFSFTIDEGNRVYPIMTGEKGIRWMKLTATGQPGHGSMIHHDNAVTKLAAAVARIGAHEFPIVWTDTLREFVTGLGKLMGTDLMAVDPQVMIDKLGPLGRIVGATLRNTANPTQLQAGYKANVIPSSATAIIDCRVIPGQEAEFEKQVDELLGPDVTREWVISDIAIESSFDVPLVEAMTAALKAEDDGSHTLPYLMSGGTDAKSFTQLGMKCYGFSPLRLPADLDFASLFHGIDERVPVDALTFGARVLDRFLASS